MSGWTHAVLEIYDMGDVGFTKDRELMADRIEDYTYAWCVVPKDDILYFMSWRHIIWVKISAHFEQWLINRYWGLPDKYRKWLDKKGWPEELK